MLLWPFVFIFTKLLLIVNGTIQIYGRWSVVFVNLSFFQNTQRISCIPLCFSGCEFVSNSAMCVFWSVVRCKLFFSVYLLLLLCSISNCRPLSSGLSYSTLLCVLYDFFSLCLSISVSLVVLCCSSGIVSRFGFPAPMFDRQKAIYLRKMYNENRKLSRGKVRSDPLHTAHLHKYFRLLFGVCFPLLNGWKKEKSKT